MIAGHSRQRRLGVCERANYVIGSYYRQNEDGGHEVARFHQPAEEDT